MDESRIGQYSISVTTYPIMALVIIGTYYLSKAHFWFQNLFSLWIHTMYYCGVPNYNTKATICAQEHSSCWMCTNLI